MICYASYTTLYSPSFTSVWVQLMEMGIKYCTSLVIDRAILQLCGTFWKIVMQDCNLPIISKYGKAFGFKLLSVYRRILEGEILVPGQLLVKFSIRLLYTGKHIVNVVKSKSTTIVNIFYKNSFQKRLYMAFQTYI